MTHTHAKDYLIELANKSQTEGWLKDLIIKIITTNGNITKEELNATTEQLKKNEVSSLTISPMPTQKSNNDLRLISLIHQSGVCALAPKQKIVFSKDITLLYGKNGSGKSSYFRILNEMVGGTKKVKIIPNIYAGTKEPINISLIYKENTSEHTITWDGKTREIDALKKVSVFDSSYTQSFLQKRTADTAIVFPFGLHLFEDLVSSINYIKDRLKSEKERIIEALPRIDMDDLSNKIKKILNEQKYDKHQKKDIQSCYVISKKQENELQEKKSNLKSLRETNFEDKIKLVKNELSLYQSLHEYLNENIKNIKTLSNETSDILENLVIQRKRREEAKTKIEILNEIGNTDSEEWKSFINAGDIYVKKTNIEKKTCPYCRQSIIDEKAKQIIAAYALFLSDKSFVELSELIKKKEEVIKKSLSVKSFSISKQFKELLCTNTANPQLYSRVSDAINNLSKLQLDISESLHNESRTKFNISKVINTLVYDLNIISSTYKKEITNLQKEQTNKSQEIEKLVTAMGPLIEHEAISIQKDLFEDWFGKINEVSEIEINLSKLSTNSISSLAKTASKTLVTDNLKTNFKEELMALGLSKLNVNLLNAGASQGQSFMQLSLAHDNPVTNILSEGEQKGVALALFIAERRMQLSKDPIILDDPVNSLDHFITAKLVERLSLLGNQIIIFSHNLLLKTSLTNLKGIHECGIDQISSCKKTSSHLFMYKVSSYGRDKKGMIKEGKQDNVNSNLDEAKKLLDEGSSNSITIGAILRHTIELMIDEKIFLNQIPVKFHGRKNNIPWNDLKKLNPNVCTLIDSLNNLYNRLSGGSLHSGIEQLENSIDHDELEEIYKELETL